MFSRDMESLEPPAAAVSTVRFPDGAVVALEWIARSGLDLAWSGPGVKGLGIPEP
jgi:hypothetical protein